MIDRVLPAYPLQISEATLAEIAEHSEAIPNERLSGALTMLTTLYALAHFHALTSSRKVRSDLDFGIKDLLHEVRQLDCALQLHRWIFDPMHLASVDKWMQANPQRLDAMESRSVPRNPLETLAYLEDLLEQLTDGLKDLQHVAGAFDRIDTQSALLSWIGQNRGEVGHRVRVELSSYLAKSRIGADTLIIRNIAELYEYAFSRKFSVNSVGHTARYNKTLADLYEEDDAPPNRQLISDYSGPGIVFASAVIHSLGLRGAFLPQPSDDPRDRRRISLTGKRSATDLELANRIGDIWKNDLRRRKK